MLQLCPRGGGKQVKPLTSPREKPNDFSIPKERSMSVQWGSRGGGWALLLCDEPSLGLAPLVTQEIIKLLAELPARGTTVLLVEQNARLALRIARRAYVLETGTITLEGPARDLLENQELKTAYLGG
jgi:ABC-type hemin transport system ATPase subunit